jgi:hypothetical protein
LILFGQGQFKQRIHVCGVKRIQGDTIVGWSTKPACAGYCLRPLRSEAICHVISSDDALI